VYASACKRRGKDDDDDDDDIFTLTRPLCW
jgi:hypothetical protein